MIDQWCGEYEQRIRDKGGIGFFLGGIGLTATLRSIPEARTSFR